MFISAISGFGSDKSFERINSYWKSENEDKDMYDITRF